MALHRFGVWPLAAACLGIPACTPAPNGGDASAKPVDAADDGSEPKPPVAQTRPHEVSSPHGPRADDYFWLRDDTRKNPDVLAYLEAENEYKEAVLAPVTSLREGLYNEIIGRIAQDDETVPYRDRGYLYYSRYEKGREYKVYARKRDSEGAEEEVLLDANVEAASHEFYRVSERKVSPNGALLAYCEDAAGRGQYTIRFKDLTSGKLLPDRIVNAKASVAWAADNATLFYIDKDPVTLLGVRVKRHKLGADATSDSTVYEEPDHTFYMELESTGDHKYIAINLASTTTGEVRFVRATKPETEFRVLAPRQAGVEYEADHGGGRWVIRTNDDARNFRLMQVRDAEVGTRARWKELVRHDPAVLISDFALFKHHIAIAERRGGLQRIRIRRNKGGKETAVGADEAAYAMSLGDNEEQSTPWLRYVYTSLTTPKSTYEVHMGTGERRLLKQDPVVGDFDPKDYTTERLSAPARDGTAIPVTVAYRRGLQKNGTAPLYQYGYGSYGASLDPRFEPTLLSLLDRGFVYAIAHVRGGQELGRAWYEDGRLLRKKNTFTDFIDVTGFLTKERYAARDKVVAMGRSAGGLLMGAISNMRPDLYRVIVAHVPFVDVVTTMLDESIPLTTNEFDEWGNPKKKTYYDYMLSYSPYDNVEDKEYPAMLVTTGLWDSQVQYFEPAKWVAKLRARKIDDNTLLLHTNMDAGHGGSSGRFRRQRETALEYAFILQQLGLAGESAPPQEQGAN